MRMVRQNSGETCIIFRAYFNRIFDPEIGTFDSYEIKMTVSLNMPLNVCECVWVCTWVCVCA